MIPKTFIQAWSAKSPWPEARQVEQDLILCRAICDLFKTVDLQGRIAFRGGTAINKLLFQQPLRYSEDIDLVQAKPEPIGATVDAIREALNWLGKCKRVQVGHSMRLVFRFAPETEVQSTLKLKVEINTREHSPLFGIRQYSFGVESDWYRGKTNVASFEPEELFGTKLRALLQRRKNRDLFDLYHGLNQLNLDHDKLIAAFNHYLALEGKPISRALAEQRMLEKLARSLSEDVEPLLPAGIFFNDKDALLAFESVWRGLIVRLPGDPWRLTEQVLDELRQGRYPNLLRANEPPSKLDKLKTRDCIVGDPEELVHMEWLDQQQL